MDMWNMNLHFTNVHWCESPLMLDRIIMFWIKRWIKYELIPIYCQDELKISSSWSFMVWFSNKFEAKFHRCKHHFFVLYERLAHCNAKVGKNDHHILCFDFSKWCEVLISFVVIWELVCYWSLVHYICPCTFFHFLTPNHE